MLERETFPVVERQAESEAGSKLMNGVSEGTGRVAQTSNGGERDDPHHIETLPRAYNRDFDLTIERAAARVRRYLADPQACQAAIERLMAELRADGLSRDDKMRKRAPLKSC